MLMSSRNSPAKLVFGPTSFKVIRPGQHVVCAMSGEIIPLEELRYWSVEKQEPYASAQLATQALVQTEAEGK